MKLKKCKVCTYLDDTDELEECWFESKEFDDIDNFTPVSICHLKKCPKKLKIDCFVRLCPICEKILYYHEFIDSNNHTKKYDKYWNNSRLAIPCCECFKLLKVIKSISFEKYQYSTELIKLLTSYFNDIQADHVQHCMIIIKNLKKFGII